MKRIVSNISAVVAALALLGCLQAAFAQPDPPERVARLNFIEGAVSYLPSGGDENDWVTATLNRPLTTGDRLWADANSRSELHIGSTAIRMDSNTGISFLNLDDVMAQIRLSDGSIILHLRRLDKGNTLEVDTPNVAFSILRPGTYRIDAHSDANETVITVRQGEGEVVGGGRSYRVISDQQVVLTGTDSLGYDLRRAGSQPMSELEMWARSRDEREDRAAATRYVSVEMTGYEDLDAYGAWESVPEYGWCWRPRGIEVGWAPYRHGHWVWVAPWGWTWVAEEPWGFAPFHYGRWAYYRSAWMWVPGPVVPRPVYAPALVAWVGGSNFGVSVAIGGRGGVGWFPLGPREVFVPSYRVSERYVTNVNITNTVVNRTTVINVYNRHDVQNVTFVNRGAPNGMTVVSHETFVNARPVARGMINVQAREVASAPVAFAPGATPERTSVYGAGSRNAPRPPAQVTNRPVVVRNPPAAMPNHFERPQNVERPQSAPPDRSRPAPADRPTTTAPNRPAYQPPDRSRTGVPNRQPNVRPDVSRPAPQTLAKPAPPVRQPSSAERQDEKAKQKAWQNERSQSKQNQKENKDQKPPSRRPGS